MDQNTIMAMVMSSEISHDQILHLLFARASCAPNMALKGSGVSVCLLRLRDVPFFRVLFRPKNKFLSLFYSL